MAVMTAGQVAALVMDAGWTKESDIKTMVAIAYDESRFDTKVVGGPNNDGSKDYGLFQINSVHKPTSAEKTQPMANTKKAFTIYKSQGLKAWATYNKGLSGAAKKQGDIGYKKVIENPDYAKKVVKQELTPTIQEDVKQGAGIPGAITGAVKGGVDAITGALFKVGINMGAVVLAFILLIMGIVILSRTPLKNVVGAVAKVKGVTTK